MSKSGTSLGPEILISLDREGPAPLRVQLEESLRGLVRSGALEAGGTLPATRTLAADLGVSRRLVLEAYGQLAAEGYLIAEPRRQTTVAAIGGHRPSLAPVAPSRPRLDLRPRTSDLTEFPRRQWSKAMARAIREAPDAAFDYPDRQGAPELREQLASYLRRVRGVVAEPRRILVCAGFTQALGLAVRVLCDQSGGGVGVEEPGLVGRDRIVAAAGGRSEPIPVDEEGMSVAALRRSGAGIALVTPAHQFPTGVPMSPRRRGELLGWAAEGGIVIEDDYDAEFRYDRAAIGALQGLAPEQVIYVGSASKTLAPALRLGWMVAPGYLIDRLADAKTLQDQGNPTLDQLAMANLIEAGAYDRHLRLLRRKLARRRKLLLAELEATLPELSVSGAAAGLHVITTLPADASMSKLAYEAEKRGLGLGPISRYCLTPPGNPRQLVLGFGGFGDAAIPTVVDELAAAIGASRGDP